MLGDTVVRIGVDIRYLGYEYTGIPVFIYDILKYWNKLYKNDEFFLYSNRNINLDIALGDNWIIRIDKKRFGTLWVLKDLYHLLQEDRIDVFWEPMHFLPLKKNNIKYFVTIHDLSVLIDKRFGSISDMLMERLFLKKSCNQADKIMAISKSTLNDVLKYTDCEPQKVCLIYNGDSPYKYLKTNLSEESHSTFQRKWRIKPKDYFLFVGTIEPRKNIITLIRAYEHFRNTVCEKKKLVLVGKKGWRSKEIYEFIQKSKYVEDIIMTGYVTEEEKELFYKDAIALVFPSLYEGFGFPIIEAMSLGVPVITSKVSSMPEVGQDVAIYIDNPDDYRNISARMQEVMNYDRNYLIEISTNGIECSKKFSRLNCAKEIYIQLENLYQS